MTKRSEASPSDRAYEGILSFIEKQGLRAGDRLPSERELCQELDVSRTTLRSALSHLASSGVIECRQGAGNYLRPDRPTTHLEDLSGLTEIAAKAGRRAGSRIVRSGVLPATGEVASRLYLPEGEPVFAMSRVRLVDDSEVCLETTHLRASSFPGIESIDFGKVSLSEALALRYGVSVSHTALKVTVSRASAEEARLLRVDEGALVFIEHGVRMDGDASPVEYYQSVYVPSRFRIVCDNKMGQATSPHGNAGDARCPRD